MPENVHHRAVRQGETFSLLVGLRDSDRQPVDELSAATPVWRMAAGISGDDFTVNQGENLNELEIRADDFATVVWPLGTFTGQLWIDWGDIFLTTGVRWEMLLQCHITVEEGLYG